MILRVVIIWFAILMLAILNGAVRDRIMTPRIGDPVARAISTLMLCVLIVLVTWLAIRWVAPPSPRAALAVGALWLVLTLVFEFGAGRYLAHKPWSELLADYNLLRGRIWAVVPIVTFFAPLWAGHARHIWGPPVP